MPVADLLSRHATSWARATRHPFLAAVRDGTVPRAAFEAWLVQDYRFVSDLLWFQGRLLARAPRAAQAVLADGALALVDELAWFEEQAVVRYLDLGAPALPATTAYAQLLRRLDDADAAVAVAALWAIERAYLDAWSFAAPGAPAFTEFVAHWTTAQFAAYVDELAQAADDALGSSSGGGSVLDAAFADVVAVECDFWEMALCAAAPTGPTGQTP